MMNIRYFILLLLVIFTAHVGLAQQPKATPTAGPGVEPPVAADSDKIYSYKEVDTKAVIQDKHKLEPYALSPDCPDGSYVLVVKAILRKSGKVTDIEVIKPMNCSFQEKVMNRVRKIRFTPALKDGVPVSQYQLFEYHFNQH